MTRRWIFGHGARRPAPPAKPAGSPPRRVRFAHFFVPLLAVVGCGGSSGNPDADPNAPDAAPGVACDQRNVARFRVTPEPDFAGMYGTQAGGSVSTAPPPDLMQTAVEANGCRFVIAAPALCEPGCTDGEICDRHGACVTYPENVAVGRVRITGTTPEIELEESFGSYHAPTTYEGFTTAGATLGLDVEGANGVAGFTLETIAIPPLELATTMFTAREHEDMSIAWTPVDTEGAEVMLRLHNDHHAGPEYVECVADASAGTLVVPASIIDAIIVAGGAGIGTYIESAWVEQRRRTSLWSERGCATFESGSDTFVQVETVLAP
jgi:hypothetical protein